MPSFLDKLKSGADKAAFEADRLMRVNQAQSAVRAAQRDLEVETGALGREVLALYDAGVLAQPELLAMCQKIDGMRQQVAALETEVERIRQEKAPDTSAQADVEPGADVPAPVPPPTPAATPQRPMSVPPPVVAATPQPPQAGTCPNCGSPLRAGVRFCPECGTRVEDV
ncbi:MAG TPA: zinc-ribbon domain-containing protein [Anaerolineae bacterium]|nr:zinc-ribbon domain-containing protein [Anaerolineae bacterium]